MQVVSFHSVADALNYLGKAEQKPEVALIDMMRPDLEAPEAMRQFTSHPSFAGINLIVLTSGGKSWFRQTLPKHWLLRAICPNRFPVVPSAMSCAPSLGLNLHPSSKAIITRHSAREELFKNKGILLVDANPGSETESLKLLSQLGTNVTPAHKIEQAVQELSQSGFDLILLGMDGFDGKTLDAMLTLMKTNGSIPIIGMTENSESTETQSCLKAGMRTPSVCQ